MRAGVMIVSRRSPVDVCCKEVEVLASADRAVKGSEFRTSRRRR